jgi:hypothetical protein
MERHRWMDAITWEGVTAGFRKQCRVWRVFGVAAQQRHASHRADFDDRPVMNIQYKGGEDTLIANCQWASYPRQVIRGTRPHASTRALHLASVMFRPTRI